MAIMRTRSGKTFDMRGLKRKGEQARYEFAYSIGGVGAGPAGEANTRPQRRGEASRRRYARRRGR